MIDGHVPLVWNKSIFVPILKQGKPRSDRNCYRLFLAITSHTAKLMEAVILNRLVHYCETNKVIPSNQAGFRKGRSTIDHTVQLNTNKTSICT